MRIVVLRHHAEDDPGFIGESLAARGAAIDFCEVAEGGALPAPDTVDGAVVLGASWSINDRASIGSWIDTELEWLRAAARRNVPLLGICFGAQALSVAFGGTVERSPRVEIGWTTLDPAPGSGVDAGPWMEFHEDCCHPPAEAEILASNDVAVQAFRLGRHLAVQFHPEVDGAQLARWIDNGAAESVGVQGLDAQTLIAQTVAEEPAARRRADGLVDLWLRGKATTADQVG